MQEETKPAIAEGGGNEADAREMEEEDEEPQEEAAAAVKAEAETPKKRKKRKRASDKPEPTDQEIAGMAGVGVRVEKPKVRKLGGGLAVKDLVIGCGDTPSPGSLVNILYTGEFVVPFVPNPNSKTGLSVFQFFRD